MAEGLTLVHAMLLGAGLRDRVRVVAAGKVLTGFSLVRTLAMGADVCNAARAMLFSIGCIQSFKCNTNTCPTGITTQDPRLMAGLHVPDKAERARQFHAKTVHVALEIVGALGHESAAQVTGKDVLRRVAGHGLRNLNEIYPCVAVFNLQPSLSAPRHVSDLPTPPHVRPRARRWITTEPGALVNGTAAPVLQAMFDGKEAHTQFMWERA
jgi:hypothetical protein